MTVSLSEALYEFAIDYARTHCSGSLISDKKLRGACYRPFHTFDGRLLRQTLVSQAAALLQGIASVHAFDDGNKRTAWMTTVFFLASHGQTLGGFSDDEGEEIVVSLVTHDLPFEDAERWIAQHLAPITE